MANEDTPRGFWPSYHLTGGQIRVRAYEVVNTNGSLLSKGDVSSQLSTGYVDLAAANVGTVANGVFSHFEYTDADGVFKATKQVPATKTNFTNIKAFVWDDPQIVFGCQADGNTVFADVGNTANHVATAADTTRKISQHEFDSSDINTGAQFKLLDKIDEPNNDWGTNVNVLVIFNEHHYKAAVAGV